MAAIEPDEVRPGIVIHFSPEALRAAGGCRVKVEPGKETNNDHYSLVVKVDVDQGECLATPIFSAKNGIRDKLLLE